MGGAQNGHLIFDAKNGCLAAMSRVQQGRRCRQGVSWVVGNTGLRVAPSQGGRRASGRPAVGGWAYSAAAAAGSACHAVQDAKGVEGL